MLVIPALDLSDGACMQFASTVKSTAQSRRNDPISIAVEWARVGFRRLHVADVNASMGRGSNDALIRDLLREVESDVQVGGGVKSGDGVQQLIDDGAEFVVLSTRALEEPDWLAGTASVFPARLIVTANVQERRVVTHRDATSRDRSILDVVEELNDIPLATLLITMHNQHGRFEGAELCLLEDVADLSVHPVLGAGGVSTLQELRALADRGLAGMVVGAALYSGVLDARAVAEEFCQ
jgi:phosphoribosylformimino-5-aminoimidazole carboxamide ribotide isomerase